MIKYIKYLSIGVMLFSAAPALASTVLGQTVLNGSTHTFDIAASSNSSQYSFNIGSGLTGSTTAIQISGTFHNALGSVAHGFFRVDIDDGVNTCTFDGDMGANATSTGIVTLTHIFQEIGLGCHLNPLSDYNLTLEVQSNITGSTASWDGATSTTSPLDNLNFVQPTGINDEIPSPYVLVLGDFDNTTHIATVTPYDGQTAATSTGFTFAATGYVNAADYRSGMSVKITYDNGGFASSLAVGPSFAALQQQDSSASYIFPLTSSGFFSFSTTTNIQVLGNYTLNTTVQRPVVNIFGFSFFNTDLAASSTAFIVATSTAFGTLRGQVVQEYLNFTGAASSTIDTSVCNPISGNFSILPCMSILFIPSQSQISSTVSTLHDGVLAKFPWGYATRLASIFTGGATGTLPSISATIITGPSTTTDDLVYNIDTNEMLAGAAATLDNLRDPIHGQNLEDVGKPYVQMVVALFVLIIIWHDVMAMGHNTRPREKSGKAT